MSIPSLSGSGPQAGTSRVRAKSLSSANNAQIAAIHSTISQLCCYDRAAACSMPRGCAAVEIFTGSSSALGFKPASARDSWYRVSCRAHYGFQSFLDDDYGMACGLSILLEMPTSIFLSVYLQHANRRRQLSIYHRLAGTILS